MADPRVKAELEKIHELFSSDKILEIPDKLAQSFIEDADKPSNHWSYSNQLIMWANGFSDGRTYNQWVGKGRHVLKGSKAFYILKPVPIEIETNKVDKVTGEKEKRIILTFASQPEFDITQTEGCPLGNPKKREHFPLQEVAKAWGVQVSFAKIHGELGHYSPWANEIVMGVTNPDVFFHELAHKAHEKLDGKLKGGQDAQQEMIAELSACVISSMYGQKIERKSFDYISQYTDGHTPEQVGKALVKVLSKVQKVVELIFSTAEKINGKPVVEKKKRKYTRKPKALVVAQPRALVYAL